MLYHGTLEVGTMNNFEKYFVKPKSRGFSKNFLSWKTECVDYEKYQGTENPAELYLFYHPDANRCQHPECSAHTKFITVARGFERTCCRVHSMELTSLEKYGVKYKSQMPEFREKVKSTVQEKYGCCNVFQSAEFKEKSKKTNLEKYGFESAMQNSTIKEKVITSNIKNNGGIGFQTGRSKETMLEKYGVENPSQVEKFQEKKKQTFISNYGVDNPMKNKDIQKKVKATNLEKYGVENIFEDGDYIRKKFNEKYGVEYPMHVAEFKEKSRNSTIDNNNGIGFQTGRAKKTMLEKYGVEHPMQSLEIQEKSKNSLFEKYGVTHNMHVSEFFEKSQKNMYKKKEYTWKTGEISILQGFEPQVLKELEDSGYKFDEIKTKYIDMPEIYYFFNGMSRRYYPDFFIPDENLFIEVKSDYTLMSKEEENKAKFKAVKDAGYELIA